MLMSFRITTWFKRFLTVVALSTGLDCQQAGAQFWEGEWLITDPTTGAYLPFTPGPKKLKALSFIIKPGVHQGKWVKVCAEVGSSLLMDGNLVYHYNQTACQDFEIDSLKDHYSGRHLFFTIYNPDPQVLSNYRYSIVIPGSTNTVSSDALELIPIPRGNKDFGNFFVLGLVTILAFLAGFFRFQYKTFISFYNLGSIFSFRTSTTGLQSLRLFERANLLLLSFHSILVAFVVVVAANARPDWAEVLPGFDAGSFYANTLYWGAITVVLFLFYFLKFGTIVQISLLFGLRQFQDQHFLDYLRLSMVFFLALFGLLVLVNLSTPLLNNGLVSLLAESAFLFMIARVVIIFLKLNSYSPNRRLHLISYLCSTEILPLVFILKLFV